MGGVAGHLAHLYDNRDLTFDKLRKILSLASSGELEGTEKTDGFNIYLGYNNGAPRFARNKTDMRTGGRDMDFLKARDFAGGDDVKQVYLDAFDSFAKAVATLTPDERRQIFGENGEIFYNTEIMGPGASNVVNYDADVMTIHHGGHKRYNLESDKVEAVDASGPSKFLDRAIDKMEEMSSGKRFNIQRTAVMKLKGIDNDHDLRIALERIQKAGLHPGMTIGEYIEDKLLAGPGLKYYDPDIRQAVIDRVLKKEEHLGLPQLYKNFNLDKTRRKEVKEFVDASPKLISSIIFPIEDAIHDFSVEMLRGLQSAYILDNANELGRLKTEVGQAIKAIQAYEGEGREEAQDVLLKQLNKIKNLENISTAAEGFVFEYEGQLYKFTGNFAPINQILGLFKYGRGSVPAIATGKRDIDPKQAMHEEDEDPYDYREDMEQWEREQYYKEQGEDEGKTIALFPGKFKPPHAGHFAAAKYYADKPEVEEVRVIISRNQKVEHGPDERLVVTPEMSQAIWDVYTADEPKIKAWVTSAPTPVQEAYDEIIALNAGDTVMMVIGDKDVKLGDTRYDAVPAYAEKHGVNYELDPVKEVDINVPENLSATEMRRYILGGQKEAFFEQLPPKLSPDQKESIFNLLQSGIQKKTRKNESVSSLADIRRLVEEVMNEVESEKQRRWACAQVGDDFKGEKKLNKDQAEEMCTAEVEEGLGDFFRGEAAAEKAMDQAWLLKLASERDKYLKLSTADRSDVAQLLAVTPERLNQLAAATGKMYYEPIDAGVEPWILVRQKMAQIQKKLFDTEEPLSFSDASELEELSSMGGGSVEGGGVAKRDTGALNSKKRKKKRDTLIREDGEQFINEVLNYILSNERK